MLADMAKQKKLHDDLANVGLRAQATAVGLVQLCIELRRANLIDQPAVDRIKSAVAAEIVTTAPRAVSCEAYRRDVRDRLDRLFAGEQDVGSADAMTFGAAQH